MCDLVGGANCQHCYEAWTPGEMWQGDVSCTKLTFPDNDEKHPPKSCGWGRLVVSPSELGKYMVLGIGMVVKAPTRNAITRSDWTNKDVEL